MCFECTLFTRPLANDCPHQRPFFDKNVSLDIGSLQFTVMLEWIMRLNDYFFNQLLGALSDANPYQKLIDEINSCPEPIALLES